MALGPRLPYTPLYLVLLFFNVPDPGLFLECFNPLLDYPFRLKGPLEKLRDTWQNRFFRMIIDFEIWRQMTPTGVIEVIYDPGFYFSVK